MKFPRRSQLAPTPTVAIDQMVARFPAAPAAADLRAGITSAAKDYAEVFATHSRVSRDPTLTDAARLVRSAKFAKTRMAGAADRLAAARSKTAEFRAHLNREISRAFSFAEARFADVVLADRIQQHFSGLSMKDRAAAVVRAIDANAR